MKLSKKQRRLAHKLWFPLVALVMMATTMAIAGADNRTPQTLSR